MYEIDLALQNKNKEMLINKEDKRKIIQKIKSDILYIHK
jgi:adenine-specific DNA methylase